VALEDLILKNIWRHKLRSMLTVLGIFLAIASIVALGSISEGINTLVEKQLEFAAGFIHVAEKGQQSMNNGPTTESNIDIETALAIAHTEGIEEYSLITYDMVPELGFFVMGMELDKLDLLNADNLKFLEGNWPAEGEQGLVIGYSIAEMKKLSLGDYITIKDDDYEIVGILEETRSMMDFIIMGSYKELSASFDKTDKVSKIILKPQDISNARLISDEIESEFDTVEALTPEDTVKRAGEAIWQIRIITLAVGFIASIVASIGIINTMVMSVSERKRELGIMKALGAKRRTIAWQIIGEAIVLSIIGGVLGLIAGDFSTGIINKTIGAPLAAVTPELAAFAFLYGVVLAIVASFYPARSAMDIDAADAMREGSL